MNKTNKLEDIVLTFVEGILGFENIVKYEFSFCDDDSPFFYLQSQEGGHPSFLVCDPVGIINDYEVDYDAQMLLELEAQSADDLRCITIITIASEVAESTVNLRSPIIFNINNNFAKQYVLKEKNYSVKYKMFEKNRAVSSVC